MPRRAISGTEECGMN